MLITGVSVEAVGRFVRPASVRGFGPGVNVLAASNEAGKSTLFRAIRACLFKRHDSRDEEVRNLACSDSQLPATIAVAFERDGRAYEIRKSFLRSASATLSEDGREIARGRQADDKVCELIGVEAGSGRTIDDGAFGVLWVGQGKSMLAPRIEGKADDLLSAAIEAEVGSMVGGERARTVMSSLQTELRRYLTDTGRTKTDGPLGAAERELSTQRAAEEDFRTRVAVLEGQFGELASLRSERTRLSDRVQVAEAEAELAEAVRLLNEGKEAAALVAQQESFERAAQARLETARQRLAQLTGTIEKIDAARGRQAALTALLSDLVEREQAARDAVSNTKGQFWALDGNIDGLDRRALTLRGLGGAIAKAHGRADAAQKLNLLEDAAGRLLSIDAELGQIIITAAALKTIEGIERQQAELHARLAAAAPKLSIEVKEGGTGKVRVGDQVIVAHTSGPVIDPTTIDIAGVATITIMPAVADAQEAETQRRKLADDLKQALQKARAASAAEAATAFARRRDLEAQRQGVRAELKALGAEGDDAAAALIARLKKQIVDADLAVQEALSGAEIAALPTAEEVETQQAVLKVRRDGFQGQRAALSGRREAQDGSLEQAVTARSAAEAELAGLQRTLEADLSICPDATRGEKLAELSKEVDGLQVKHEQAAAALAEQRRQAPDKTELERREIRCTRLRQQTENRRERLLALAGLIGSLEGQIQHAGGDGLSELLASSQELRQMAERSVAAINARLAALRLLQETVSGCLAEGQERYFAPVRRHLRPFLHDLFPGAELHLGEGFEIAGIRRTGDQPEPYERLSDGTQEQIAVLVRLAMGALLAERQQSVPIVLDDALVFSDDDRIPRMFDALSRAGQQQQVIVLTCRTKAFEQLGGRTLRIES